MGNLNGTRVFLVDDDASVRKATRRLLAAAGHDSRDFASGREFLDTVPPETKGVLVLDLRMPEMDGFALQRRLTELNSPLKVILATAYVQPGDREQGLGAGAIGFLVKPFMDVDLLGLVESGLGA